MSKFSLRRVLRRTLWISTALLFTLLIYALLPWLGRLPSKFGPLWSYRVYETGRQIDGSTEPTISGWREPLSRWELLSTRDVDIIFDHKQVERVHRLAKVSPRPPRQKPIEPINIRSDDTLHDFVLEFGDSFGYPDSQAQLDEAVKRGDAQRASDFFTYRLQRPKPFYGQIPLSFAYPQWDPEFGSHRLDELEIRDSGELIRTQLKAPSEPEIIIVAASGITNVKYAVYNGYPPINYNADEYWAVIYAGSTLTNSRHFALDRITIGQTSTEVLLSASKLLVRDGGHYPYWFFVPLGHLPDGPYSVTARIADTNDLLASTTADLRRATEHEARVHSDDINALQFAASHVYNQRLNRERSHGAALQVRLQRLANSMSASGNTRPKLINDLIALGKSVDWNQNIFQASQVSRYSLAPLAAANIPPKATPDYGEHLPPWTSADISLGDIWMCDGTDAGWYASKTYREVSDFKDALSTESPSPVQTKIRAIWNELAERSKSSNNFSSTLLAKGSIEDAINVTYDYFLDHKKHSPEFLPTDELWVVFVARRSYLIRGIRTRSYTNDFGHESIRQYLIDTSAYVAEADGVAESDWAPVTLALIPLGKAEEKYVNVMFSNKSICACDNNDPLNLIDANPPDQWAIKASEDLAQPMGFSRQH